MARKAKRDNYQEVTDRIIEALEAGVAPWVCPWDRALGMPRNGQSGHIYQGINTWLTFATAWAKGFMDPRWWTFNQVRKNHPDAHVRKGEKGTLIIKWLFLKPKRKTDETDEEYKACKNVPLLKTYTVFNAEQIEWGEDGAPKLAKGETFDLDKVNAEATEFLKTLGATIKHGGAKASYDRHADVILLPAPEVFKTSGDYFATAFHEVIHWTGNKDRCDRDLKGRFGSEAYAVEELVAELGAAFLCTDYSIKGKLQHANYISIWIRLLKSDKYGIFTAARLARDAANFTKIKLPDTEAKVKNVKAKNAKASKKTKKAQVKKVA